MVILSVFSKAASPKSAVSQASSIRLESMKYEQFKYYLERTWVSHLHTHHWAQLLLLSCPQNPWLAHRRNPQEPTAAFKHCHCTRCLFISGFIRWLKNLHKGCLQKASTPLGRTVCLNSEISSSVYAIAGTNPSRDIMTWSSQTLMFQSEK